MGKEALHSLPILYVTTFTSEQIKESVKLFDDMSNLKLLTMYEIGRDSVWREWDKQFARNVLRLPEFILDTGGPPGILRMKLSKEPSIRGQKQ